MLTNGTLVFSGKKASCAVSWVWAESYPLAPWFDPSLWQFLWSFRGWLRLSSSTVLFTVLWHAEPKPTCWIWAPSELLEVQFWVSGLLFGPNFNFTNFSTVFWVLENWDWSACRTAGLLLSCLFLTHIFSWAPLCFCFPSCSFPVQVHFCRT